MSSKVLTAVVALAWVATAIFSYQLGRTHESSGSGDRSGTPGKGAPPGSGKTSKGKGTLTSGTGPDSVKEGDPKSGGQGDLAGAPDPKSVEERMLKAKMAAIMGLGNPVEIARIMEEVSKLTEADMEEAIRQARSIPGAQSRDLLTKAVLGHWAKLNPLDAATYAREKLDTAAGVPALTIVLSSWAQNDHRAAFQWTQDLIAADDSNLATQMKGTKGFFLLNVYGAMAANEPDWAFERYREIEDAQEREIVLAGMLVNVQRSEERRAWLERIATIEDVEERARAHRSLVNQMSQVDIGMAAVWIEEMPDPALRAELAGTFARRWMTAQPREAADWLVQQIEDPDARAAAVSEMVTEWGRHDTSGVAEWLGDLGAGEETDPARAAFAGSIVAKDPESAFAWANSITRPSLRLRSLQNVYAGWSVRDPAAAEEALRGAGLSEVQTEQVLAGNGEGE